MVIIMKNLKIEELKKELNLGELGEYFADYDSGYICDIITEIADNHINIYTSDLFDWAKNYFNYIEEANTELGTPKDILQQIQQGQFYYYEQNIYNNLEDIMLNYMYNYIENVLNIKEITEEQYDDLLDFDFNNNNEMLENLIDHINEVLKIEEA